MMGKKEQGTEAPVATAVLSPQPSTAALVLGYSDLHSNVEAVFRRAQDGVKTCKALTVLMQQTAFLEETYGSSIVKVGEGFAAVHDPNAPTLSKAWAGICTSIQSLGRQHTTLSSSISQDVGKNMATYSDQQCEVVRRMINETQAILDEMTKERSIHRKIKEKYRKACKEAESILKLGSNLKASLYASSSPVTSGVDKECFKSNNREQQQQGSAGHSPDGTTTTSPAASSSAATTTTTTTQDQSTAPPPQAPAFNDGLTKIDQLWNKVWDQMSGGTSTSSSRIQERATEAIVELKATEADYLFSKKNLEAREQALQSQLKEHLGRFQVNEEARIYFIKQHLQRLGLARRAMLDKIEKTLRSLCEAVGDVDPSADLAIYLQQVTNRDQPAEAGKGQHQQQAFIDGEESDTKLVKATQPAIKHVDRCIKNLRTLCLCFSDLSSAEESYAKNTLKMVEKSGYISSSSSINGGPSSSHHHHHHHHHGSSSFRKCLDTEGPSIRQAIQQYMVTQESIGKLHANTAIRIAQSVCVILAQTQDELSGSRQEILLAQNQSTKALQATRSQFTKVKQRADGKARDLMERTGQLGITQEQHQQQLLIEKDLSSTGGGGNGLSVSMSGSHHHHQHGQQRLEARIETLRDEVQASDEALVIAEEALTNQRAGLASQVEIILQALSVREEDRLNKTKIALMELYQAQSLSLFSSSEEEDQRQVVVDAIDITSDLQAFIAAHISALATDILKDRPPQHQPTPPTSAAEVQQQQQQQLLPTYGTILTERLDELVRLIGGGGEITPMQSPQLLQQQAIKSTSSVSSSFPSFASSSSSSSSSSAAATITTTTTTSKSSAIISTAANQQMPLFLPYLSLGDSTYDEADRGGLERTASAGEGMALSRRRSLTTSLGSVDLGFSSSSEKEGDDGEDGEREEEEATMKRTITPLLDRTLLSTTRLPASMSPRPFDNEVGGDEQQQQHEMTISFDAGAAMGQEEEEELSALPPPSSRPKPIRLNSPSAVQQQQQQQQQHDVGDNDAVIKQQQQQEEEEGSTPSAARPKAIRYVTSPVAGAASKDDGRESHVKKEKETTEFKGLFPDSSMDSTLFRGIEIAGQTMSISQSIGNGGAREKTSPVPIRNDFYYAPYQEGQQRGEEDTLSGKKGETPIPPSNQHQKPCKPMPEQQKAGISEQQREESVDKDGSESGLDESATAKVLDVLFTCAQQQRKIDQSSSSSPAFSSAFFEQSIHQPFGRQLSNATATRIAEEDAQTAEEIKPFNLPPGEKVVESYSCALLPNNLLIHGRLYVTQHFICFGSWGNTRLVLPTEDVSFIEKANTMGFVPNALWIVMRAGDRYFFSSFLYRDDCFDVIFSLLPKRLAIMEMRTLGAKKIPQALKDGEGQQQEGDQEARSTNKPVAVQEIAAHQPFAASKKKRSPLSFGRGASSFSEKRSPTVAIIPSTAAAGGVAAAIERGGIPSQQATVASLPRSVSTKMLPLLQVQEDIIIQRMLLMTNEELDCGVEKFLKLFWGETSTFYVDYLRERGDKAINIGPWLNREEQDGYSGEAFTRVREIKYDRSREGMSIGPKSVPTREFQMYRYHDPAHPDDRVLFSTVLSFKGVPYCEYFTVQTRWVVTRVGMTNKRCRLQVGLDVVFRQSVLLKAAIKSGTEGEMKKGLEDWLARARKQIATFGVGFSATSSIPSNPPHHQIASVHGGQEGVNNKNDPIIAESAEDRGGGEEEGLVSAAGHVRHTALPSSSNSGGQSFTSSIRSRGLIARCFEGRGVVLDLLVLSLILALLLAIYLLYTSNGRVHTLQQELGRVLQQQHQVESKLEKLAITTAEAVAKAQPQVDAALATAAAAAAKAKSCAA